MQGERPSALLTFLIADVRGYTRYTRERGDEQAASVAARFAELARRGITEQGGELLELRGDEALGVFGSRAGLKCGGLARRRGADHARRTLQFQVAPLCPDALASSSLADQLATLTR